MPPRSDKDLSPVAKGIMTLAAELDHRAAKWEAGDVDSADAAEKDYADGLRDGAELLRKFARS